MSETKIRQIAYAVYKKKRDDGLEGDPKEDWKAAEEIFNHKLKYFGWLIWRFLEKTHYPVIALVAILSLIGNVVMMTWNIQTNATSTDLGTRPYLSINMERPIYDKNEQGAFYGNDIILKNAGRYQRRAFPPAIT